MRLKASGGNASFAGLRYFLIEDKNASPTLAEFDKFTSKIVQPDVSNGVPIAIVDHILPPWLLFWFAGPELQASDGSSHDLEQEQIVVFKSSLWVRCDTCVMPAQ